MATEVKLVSSSAPSLTALVDSAPGALNTLNELAAALNDDANFSTTITNSIATKAPSDAPTFTGNATFDTTTLVVDSSNDRVGIGTASPSNPLHIVDSRNYTFSSTADASTNMAGIRLTNSNNNNNWAGLWFGTGSAAGTHWSGIAGARSDSTSTWGTHLSFFTHEDTIQNITQASERLRIDPAGNVGIGTTNPSSNLHVETNTHANIRIQAGANSSASLRLRNDAVDWDVNCQTNDNFAIYSQTASAERLVINGSGHISTPSQPGARLGLPANQTVTSAAWVDLNFSDTNSSYLMYNKGLTLSSNTITVPTAGRYFICAQFRSEADPFSDATQFAIYINNAASGGSYAQAIRLYIDENYAAQYTHAPPLQGIFDLVAGARIQVRAIAGSGSFTLSSTSNTVNHLSIIKVA